MEEEWLTALDPLEVFTNLYGKPSWRKLRLAAVACCHRMKHLLVDKRSIRAVDVAELYADKLQGLAAIGDIEYEASQVVETLMERGRNPTSDAAHCAAMCLAVWAPADWGTFQVFQWSAATVAREERIGILACVFGVPHRQRRLRIQCDPSWRTSAVLALAQSIYDEKAFDRMPILTDALQDAGCDNDDILNHLRDATAPHVRGCWALDLVLGKE